MARKEGEIKNGYWKYNRKYGWCIYTRGLDELICSV